MHAAFSFFEIFEISESYSACTDIGGGVILHQNTMLNWKRTLATSAFLFLPIAAFGQLNIGDRLTGTQISKNKNVECAATPSQTYPCVQGMTDKGIVFSIVGYDAKTKRIKYLYTIDEHFRTKEGLKVGDWIEVSEDQLIPVTGGFIYGPKTKEGWHIIVGRTLGITEQVQFQDGTVIYPTESRTVPPRVGKVQIRGFDKGGV